MSSNSQNHMESVIMKKGNGPVTDDKIDKATDSAMTAKLTANEQERLQYYRDLITRTDYVPLTDTEVADIKERRIQSDASAAIEGLYGTPMDDCISDLFEELAVPESLRLKILNDFTAWSLQYTEHVAAE